jgi:hypothetical protein
MSVNTSYEAVPASVLMMLAKTQVTYVTRVRQKPVTATLERGPEFGATGSAQGYALSTGACG